MTTLRALGRDLAGSTEWWGADREDPGEVDGPKRASVLALDHVPGAGWRVRVRNAAGLVVIGGWTLEVRPKIPMAHYLYLLERADVIPRRDAAAVGATTSDSLWSLVAQWHVDALAKVLRADLIRDYREVRETLQLVRGRLDILPTTVGLYKGRLELHCVYEDFDVDNALNRVLKAATKIVVGNALLRRPLRRDAARLLSRLDQVGDLRPGDINVRPDLRTSYYSDALQLARHILTRQGRTIRVGQAVAWSFLLPSPLAVEAGVRAILSEGLLDLTTVAKGKKKLVPTNYSLNPDLIFGDGAQVGDVKYTRTKPDWSRAHIYQVTTFAAGYRSSQGMVIGFQPPSVSMIPPPLTIGDVELTYLAWNADPEIPPTEAATQLVADCRAWLTPYASLAASDLQLAQY